ncbi:MAG: HEAT repeat domain-containing protein [Methylacidiphilales bacterium]|nr:HEAT repeat domain-containing protein [Candidatus Methylacidiphilales bacterium]
MSKNYKLRFFPLTSVSIISRIVAALISIILPVIVPKTASAQQPSQEHISNLLPQLNIDKGQQREQIIAELDYLGKDAIPELIAVLKDDNNSVNIVATKGFKRINELQEKELIKQLQNSLNTRESWTAIAVLDNQGLSSPQTANMFAKALISILEDKAQPDGLRSFAANALGNIQVPLAAEVANDAVSGLIPLLKQKNKHLQISAVYASGKVASKTSDTVFEKIQSELSILFQSEDKDVSRIASDALDFIDFDREERSKYQQSIFGNKLFQNQWILILGGTLISFLLICHGMFSKYFRFQSKQV